MASGLAPIVVPPNSPMVPEWAREAVRRLNMISAATLGQATDEGGFGANAFAYGSSNAQLLLPKGFSGRLTLDKLTAGGNIGWIQIDNGRITNALNPT